MCSGCEDGDVMVCSVCMRAWCYDCLQQVLKGDSPNCPKNYTCDKCEDTCYLDEWLETNKLSEAELSICPECGGLLNYESIS